MVRLLDELGHPEKDFKAFHIAGTNGKGSTSYMIASILEEAGYTVGLYTSPHLVSRTERIQLWNGKHKLISEDKFSGLETIVNEAASRLDKGVELHTFDIITAVAYLYFAETQPDYVVLECGLGGRLDSTNTIEQPLVSVITQIGLDHTAQLGNTIYKIVHEKVGIVKPAVPVVSQSSELAIQQVISRTAKSMDAPFTDVSQSRSKFKKYKLGMLGNHQIDNAATAVMAIKAAGIDVSEEAIKAGLLKAVIPGRFEIIKKDLYWILDGGHNPNAIESACKTLNFFTRSNKIKKTLILFGCMKDKNYNRMVQLLCSNARNCDYATVDIDEDRAEDSQVLGERFASNGHECVCYESVQEAYDDISSKGYDCVLVIGSIYLVGAMKKVI